MYEEHLVAIEELTDINTEVSANFTNILKLAQAADGATQRKIVADIQARRKGIEENLEKYGKKEFGEEEKGMYEAMKAKLAAFDGIVSRSVELSASGRLEEAFVLSSTAGEESFDDLETEFMKLLEHEKKDAEETYEKSEAAEIAAASFILVTGGAVSVVCILLGVLITRTITGPISKIVAIIKKTSELNLTYDTAIEALLKYKDETGIIARSVHELQKALRDIAAKILTISSNVASHSEELTASTEENTKTVNQVVTAINEIAEGNGSQAEAVNKASSTISDIVKSIGEVNEATSESADNAMKSLETVVQGQDTVKLTAEKMQDNIAVAGQVSASLLELSEVIGKVGNITEVINSIAAQTNLLALNAAIEAARAGEAGKGFAVVAEEIRNLAEGSSSAATEIATIIRDVVEKNRTAAEKMVKAKEIVSEQEKAVDITKRAFENIESSVEDIVKRTKNAANMLNNIDTASKEILGQTQDMAAIAQESAASSEEISASSQEQMASIEMIATAASDLSSMAVDLNNEISRFKI